MNDASNIIGQLNEISLIIAKAQRDLNQGKVANLSNLDKMVSDTCEQILKLPAEEAKKAQLAMADMIGNLDTLALSLQSFQAELKEKT